MKISTVCAVLILATCNMVKAAPLPQPESLRFQLAGAYLPNFSGGFPRDPANVDCGTGWGTVIQMEFRKNDLGIEIELSQLQFDIHTSVALYGGYYGIREEDRTASFPRLGAGLSYHFKTTDRHSFFAGVRAYYQNPSDYHGGYSFSSWCIAPHIGFDRRNQTPSQWFLTANLQLNVMYVDVAGTRLVPQVSMGVGYRL